MTNGQVWVNFSRRKKWTTSFIPTYTCHIETTKLIMRYQNLKTIFLVASAYLIVSLVECQDKSGLEIHDTFKPENCARKAKAIDILTVHYKGYLKEGNTVFDSSYDRKEPFSFQLGIGQVIRGWDVGLKDICVGEKRQLVIPPELGYGKTAHDKIPANSWLVFDIECLKIEDGPNPVNVFDEIDLDKDSRLSRHEVGEFLKKQLTQSYHPESPDQHSSEEHNQMLEEVFEHEDKDKDGYITKDEFSGPKHDHEEL